MQRRALLRDVSVGLRSAREVCDAHPDLVRAGRFVGEPFGADCPICTDEELRRVTYAFYGRGATRYSGRATASDKLGDLARRHGDVSVYVVEVCTGCAWHHLLESFWVGKKAAG